jgi:hypothetical protein
VTASPLPHPAASSDGVRLVPEDFDLFARHPTRRPWGDIPDSDKARYRDLRGRLKQVSEAAARDYPGSIPMRAHQSHPTPNGRNPTGLWCCIYPASADNKSFAFQFAAIVSSAGIEICFCLGAGHAQAGATALAPLRSELAVRKKALTTLPATSVNNLDKHLQAEGWQYRRRWQQAPSSSDFRSLQDWITYAATQAGDGASISKNLSPTEAVELGGRLIELFDSWGALFTPLFSAVYAGPVPASEEPRGMPQHVKQLTDARKRVAGVLAGMLEKSNVFLAYCGDKTEELKPFDARTGFWANPADVTNKPPRWLVQLAVENGEVKARVPAAPGAHRLGFFNTAGRDVGGIAVRVIPAIRQPDGSFLLHEDWEWLLFFVFPKALRRGSSGQLVEGFNPATGKMRYLDADQPYLGAALFALCDSSDSYTMPGTSEVMMTYGQATQALQALLGVSPLPRDSQV